MYVITGATGHTGGEIARRLLSAGKKVRVIGRNAERLLSLAREGAEAFVCDMNDTVALTRAFTGAQAVYAMIPPNVASENYRAEQDRISDALSAAIAAAKVESVVSLSSVGADKDSGTGPVVGLHNLEQKLNQISGLNVLHLRPGDFMENMLAQIGIIQNMGVTAGVLQLDLKLPMIATKDIGTIATAALFSLDFSGQETHELLGERDLSF